MFVIVGHRSLGISLSLMEGGNSREFPTSHYCCLVYSPPVDMEGKLCLHHTCTHFTVQDWSGCWTPSRCGCIGDFVGGCYLLLLLLL